MRNLNNAPQDIGGILVRGSNSTDISDATHRFLDLSARLGFQSHVDSSIATDGLSIRFRLCKSAKSEWAPDFGTFDLCKNLHLQPKEHSADLEKEIWLAMLLGPVTFDYPSYAELDTSIRIRQNVVNAARRTTLSFHTSKVERPLEFWKFTEESGFTLLPGKSIIDALRMATQPKVSGQRYAFSCYRASEYVVLLGITQELALSNPELLQRIERYWESRSIKSGKFHNVFLHEYGSMSAPLPVNYYVPGDRIWFRNPDPHSSDISGYEGSWVIYLGEGLFSNFWDCAHPYNLKEKCIEIYHWRNATFTDADGELRMDETIVAERVRATLKNAEEVEYISNKMMRPRDASGVYAEGGCIDTTREYARWILPDTCNIVLPNT
jgi:hypothetical protein